MGMGGNGNVESHSRTSLINRSTQRVQSSAKAAHPKQSCMQVEFMKVSPFVIEG